MEFTGRITSILPARTGTRNDGRTWTELPFVFAYFENEQQHYEDSALISTYDTNVMAKIAQYVAKGKDGKVINENGFSKMNVGYIPCRCGFSLRAKVVAKKDGSGNIVIQEARCYKLDVATQQPATTVQQPAPMPPFAAPPQQPSYAAPAQPPIDDLPF
jgi:hypothetical protein